MQENDYEDECPPFDALDGTPGSSASGMDISLSVHRGPGVTSIECRVKLPNGGTQDKSHQAPFAMDDRELRKAIRNTINWCIRVANGNH